MRSVGVGVSTCAVSGSSVRSLVGLLADNSEGSALCCSSPGAEQFSHRSYLVIPAESSEADITRLDALCRIFGIGLILFENGQNQKTTFQIRVRAARHEPDMFYVNKNMKQVEDKLFS